MLNICEAELFIKVHRNGDDFLFYLFICEPWSKKGTRINSRHQAGGGLYPCSGSPGLRSDDMVLTVTHSSSSISVQSSRITQAIVCHEDSNRLREMKPQKSFAMRLLQLSWTVKIDSIYRELLQRKERKHQASFKITILPSTSSAVCSPISTLFKSTATTKHSMRACVWGGSVVGCLYINTSVVYLCIYLPTMLTRQCAIHTRCCGRQSYASNLPDQWLESTS